MTKFNPKNKKSLSYTECLTPAMQIVDQSDADQYLADYVAYIEDNGRTPDQALEIAKHNLGYFAGYFDNETRERVERLFKCAHPVFGAIAENGPPTFSQAIKAGMRLAKGQ